MVRRCAATFHLTARLRSCSDTRARSHTPRSLYRAVSRPIWWFTAFSVVVFPLFVWRPIEVAVAARSRSVLPVRGLGGGWSEARTRVGGRCANSRRGFVDFWFSLLTRPFHLLLACLFVELWCVVLRHRLAGGHPWWRLMGFAICILVVVVLPALPISPSRRARRSGIDSLCVPLCLSPCAYRSCFAFLLCRCDMSLFFSCEFVYTVVLFL